LRQAAIAARTLTAASRILRCLPQIEITGANGLKLDPVVDVFLKGNGRKQRQDIQAIADSAYVARRGRRTRKTKDDRLVSHLRRRKDRPPAPQQGRLGFSSADI